MNFKEQYRKEQNKDVYAGRTGEKYPIYSTEYVEWLEKKCTITDVVSSLTAKDKLYLNTLLVNKLLEKEDDGTYKAVNDIGIMDKINDLMEKVNNS